MDWNKLSTQELKDFIDLVDPNFYIKCAEEIFSLHYRDKNFRTTIPVADLYIAANYSGKIPQKYSIRQISQLSKSKLAQFATQFNISPDRERIIRILRYLNALDEEGNRVPYRTLTGGDYYLDYLILSNLSVPEIEKLCDYGGYFSPICADDNFWNLVADNHFPAVVPSLGTTWFQLVKFLTSTKDVNEGLRLAAKYNNPSLIEYYIGKGANNWDLGMEGAAQGGHKDLIEYFIGKGADDWDSGMEGAAQGGHKDLVEYYIGKGANNWDLGMQGAAQGGHKDLVQFFINKGANNWTLGMEGAAQGGHKDLVEYFINKGADGWDWGMYGAAQGGYKNLVEFFITKGAKNWELGMDGAALGGHKDLVEFFITKGSNNWDLGIYRATQAGHDDLIEFFRRKKLAY